MALKAWRRAAFIGMKPKSDSHSANPDSVKWRTGLLELRFRRLIVPFGFRGCRAFGGWCSGCKGVLQGVELRLWGLGR